MNRKIYDKKVFLENFELNGTLESSTQQLNVEAILEKGAQTQSDLNAWYIFKEGTVKKFYQSLFLSHHKKIKVK